MKKVFTLLRYLLLLGLLLFSTCPVTAFAEESVAVQTANAAETVVQEHSASAVTAEEGAVGHEEEPYVTVARLKDLLWRAISFICLVALLVKFGAKPIAEMLSGRQRQIRSEIEELEAKRDTAEKTYREFEVKLAGMEKDIESVVERAIAQAEVEKTKIIEKAEQAAADIQRQAEMAIQNEITHARRTLKNDIAEQAAVMAEQLIVKHLTADDQVKIVEDYLDKVGAVQ